MTREQSSFEQKMNVARFLMDRRADVYRKLAEIERLEEETQMNVTVRKIGNSEGVILPKEVLERLNLKAGDQLTLVERDGTVELMPKTSSLAEQLEAAREGMAQYRVALRELAK